MPLTALLVKCALSGGIAALSEILKSDDPLAEATPKALLSVISGVSTGFTQQFSGKIDYKNLTRFISQSKGDGFEELNHDIEKLMIDSVPRAFRALRFSYEEKFGSDKNETRFLKSLEEEAGKRPNNVKDYQLMSLNEGEWLDQNIDYAWTFAEVFAEDRKINLEEIDKEQIKKFIEDHFLQAFKIVFLEGLKDDKNERPYKAFIIKSLKGIEEQVSHLGQLKQEIQETIKAFKAKSEEYLTAGRVYLDEKWKAEETAFKAEVQNSLRQMLELQKETLRVSVSTKEDTKAIRDDLGRIVEKVAPTYPKFLTPERKNRDWDQYVTRGSFLQDIHRDLEAGKDSILVSGLGGVGKSTLAEAYVKTYSEEYDHIAWLEQTDGFEGMLISASSLHAVLGIILDEIPSERWIPTVFQKMAAVPGKKLLVIDNVDESIKEYKELLPAGYRILLTSRERLPLGFTIREVGKLTLEEATALIGKCLTRMTTEAEEIRAFCEQADYHVLTIELLAKTLQESLDLESLSQITSFLETNRLDAEELEETVLTVHSKGETLVYQHLLASFKLARLSEDEKWTLLQLAVLPPLPHLFEDLIDWIKVDRKALGDTLKALHRKGWINRTASVFQMHRMVQTLVRHQLPPTEENVASLLNTFSDKLRIDQTKDNPVDKFQWIVYGRFLFDAMEGDPLSSSVAILANNLGLVLKVFGDYQRARLLLEKALAFNEKTFGEHHPRTADSYSILGLVLKDLGDYQGARSLLEKALASDEKNFGEHHPTTAVRYSNLGLVLKDLGDYKGARSLLEKALASDEKNFGEHHPTTAVRYANLGLVLKDLGEYQGARSLLEKALASAETTFGEHHPTTAVCYSNLGLVLRDLGDYEGARSLLEKALASDEKTFGEHHPTTAVSYLNLGTVLEKLAQPCEGLLYVEKAYSVFLSSLGAEHPDTKLSLGWKQHLSSLCQNSKG